MINLFWKKKKRNSVSKVVGKLEGSEVQVQLGSNKDPKQGSEKWDEEVD